MEDELKFPDPNTWLAEDKVAEDAAWEEVIAAFKAKGEELPPHVSELIESAFKTGFGGGVMHSAKRLNEILKVVKKMVERARGGKG